MECSVHELHNELISHASEGGLEETKYRLTGEVIISNTMLRNIMSGQIRRMQDNHKQICGCYYCNTAPSMQSSLNECREKKVKILTEGLESVRPSR